MYDYSKVVDALPRHDDGAQGVNDGWRDDDQSAGLANAAAGDLNARGINAGTIAVTSGDKSNGHVVNWVQNGVNEQGQPTYAYYDPQTGAYVDNNHAGYTNAADGVKDLGTATNGAYSTMGHSDQEGNSKDWVVADQVPGGPVQTADSPPYAPGGSDEFGSTSTTTTTPTTATTTTTADGAGQDYDWYGMPTDPMGPEGPKTGPTQMGPEGPSDGSGTPTQMGPEGPAGGSTDPAPPAAPTDPVQMGPEGPAPSDSFSDPGQMGPEGPVSSPPPDFPAPSEPPSSPANDFGGFNGGGGDSFGGGDDFGGFGGF
jgi:hypothetical protein